jgi:hypothetical protein
MSAEPKLQRAVRTVIQIHREREEELRRALGSGDAEEVVRCVRRHLGIPHDDPRDEEGDRTPPGE